MRSIVSITVAGAILGSFSVAATADDVHDPTAGKSATSLKQNFLPDPKMMTRDPYAAKPTPGAEKRGLQLVDPARVQSGQNEIGPAPAVTAQDEDTPASAAERIVTDASRLAASAAADSVRAQDR